MQKQWKNISPRLRKKILKESKESGCVIAELARRYGIRRERIYNWRMRYLKEGKNSVGAKNIFVEAKIQDRGDEKKIRNKNNVLKKASLEFEEFTLSIEVNSLKVPNFPTPAFKSY